MHQDANWNVIGLILDSRPGYAGSAKHWDAKRLPCVEGSLVERYVYSPYGALTANQETGFGDRDGDVALIDFAGLQIARTGG